MYIWLSSSSHLSKICGKWILQAGLRTGPEHGQDLFYFYSSTSTKSLANGKAINSHHLLIELILDLSELNIIWPSSATLWSLVKQKNQDKYCDTQQLSNFSLHGDPWDSKSLQD